MATVTIQPVSQLDTLRAMQAEGASEAALLDWFGPQLLEQLRDMLAAEPQPEPPADAIVPASLRELLARIGGGTHELTGPETCRVRAAVSALRPSTSTATHHIWRLDLDEGRLVVTLAREADSVATVRWAPTAPVEPVEEMTERERVLAETREALAQLERGETQRAEARPERHNRRNWRAIQQRARAERLAAKPLRLRAGRGYRSC